MAVAGRRATRSTPLPDLRGGHGRGASALRTGQGRGARHRPSLDAGPTDGEEAVHERESRDGPWEEGRARARREGRRRGDRRADPAGVPRDGGRLPSGRPRGGGELRADEAVLGLGLSLSPRDEVRLCDKWKED